MCNDSIFYSMYYGGISPWENSKLPLSKEYTQLAKSACDMQDKLIASLFDESKALLEAFLNENSKVSGHFHEEKFKEGFIVGARLMIETLTDKRYNG